MQQTGVDTEQVVRGRYSRAAESREKALCCPVEYQTEYLKVIPREVIEKDYGCGDPSAHVKPGETVLDLGSGSGKICFIAAQVVGAHGRIIGVDMNDDMLNLARKHQATVAAAIGFDNVEFRKGRIQDLALDRGLIDNYLRENPIRSERDLITYEEFERTCRRVQPLVADESVDVVVSNCVLNLVDPAAKTQMFEEIFRVLKRGGRAVISDIVADEAVPPHLVDDAELWSGCVSGSYQESEFLRAFEEVGFYGIQLLKRDESPWRTVEGIEFRSVTVEAFKGKEGACWDHNEAVIYKGPFRSVTDDDGHTFPRGERVAVCRKTLELLSKSPYSASFAKVEPRTPVSAPTPFPCSEGVIRRDPKETKGAGYRDTAASPENCC